MNIEQRLNVIMRYIISETQEERNLAKSEVKKIMECPTEIAKVVNVEEAIETILLEIGVPSHLMGYTYTVCAIMTVIEKPDALNNITSVLYPTIAQKYDTTKSRVERGIRHSVELAWSRADLDVVEKYFGNTISPTKGKPTNSEFIACMANIVKRRIANG